jgi:predicted component of type VI protein secretion system
VSQISPPFRIAVVALLAVCALWFTVLRPKPPAQDAPLPAAPGATGLANDVAAAKGAAATSDAANGRIQAATAGTAATAAPKTSVPRTSAKAEPKAAAKTAPNAAAKPAPKAAATGKAAAPADPSTPLLRALDRDRAVVLVFWNRHGADDKAVRKAAGDVNRRHGRVLVKVAPISSVGHYTAITRGVQVLEAPTALVIAPGGTARLIAGLTSTPELDQAVSDALAAVKTGK